MSEQKDNREKIDKIFDSCYSQDLSACPKHTIFQRGKAVNELLPLIEEAKREERKDIGEWLLDEYDRTPLGKRIGLLETVISKLVDGQVLGE